jgi:hypothetical protein
LIYVLARPPLSAYIFLGNFWELGFPLWLALSATRSSTPVPHVRVPAKKSGYWVPIARGFALGYRKGPKGSVWLARLIDSRGRCEATLGPADDALDADGERILDYAQAQAKARDWLASLDAGDKAQPYTINRCLDDYITDYKRRGGKALDRLEITADAFIRSQLGTHEIAALTASMIRQWHLALAEAPARLRTRKTVRSRAEYVGLLPGGPVFIWIVDALSDLTRNTFRMAGITLQMGDVFVWNTNGKKIFPPKIYKR